jgi:aryl-alcohol dehydrogenase-like predicted oxidoreductase
MSQATRRDFLKTGLAGPLLAGARGVPAWARKKSAADWVTLGHSGVKVTRLAFGTGTFSGRVQRVLGQDGFTSLERYAYDHGIRFFETAEGYRGMPQMLAAALRGIPRDSYRLMTKFGAAPGADVAAKMDSLRKDLNTEYLDIVLMHCLRGPQWPDQTKAIQDGLSEAKSKKIVLAHGASVHGLQALGAFPGNKWLDVALLRINHSGVRMDTPDLRDTDDLGDVNQVVSQARKIHAQGTGVLGMKLIGEGQFTQPEQRQAAIDFVMKLGTVDAVTIGYKSTAEIDEAIERMNRALNA